SQPASRNGSPTSSRRLSRHRQCRRRASSATIMEPCRSRPSVGGAVPGRMAKMRDGLSAETEMLDWLSANRSSMERLLAKLVDIDSPSGDDTGVNAVAAEITAFLRENGVDVRRIPAGSGTELLKAAVGDSDQAAPVLLMGHMDT